MSGSESSPDNASSWSDGEDRSSILSSVSAGPDCEDGFLSPATDRFGAERGPVVERLATRSAAFFLGAERADPPDWAAQRAAIKVAREPVTGR